MASNSAAPLLAVEGLTMRFGGLMAVDTLSFAARGGDITQLLAEIADFRRARCRRFWAAKIGQNIQRTNLVRLVVESAMRIVDGCDLGRQF